jgi:hypothetical protein
LQNQLAKSNAGYASSNKELIVKILSLYDTFELYLKNRIKADVLDQASPLKGQDGENVKRKLDFAEESTKTETSEQVKEEKVETQQKAVDEIISNKPPAYVILKSIDETYLGQILSDNREEVYLNVSHLSCNYVMSEPNGFINRAIPEAFLNKYNVKSGPQEESKGTSAAAMLKERDAQLGVAQDVAPIIKDGNEQWAHINGDVADDENDDENGYQPDGETEPEKQVSEDFGKPILDSICFA